MNLLIMGAISGCITGAVAGFMILKSYKFKEDIKEIKEELSDFKVYSRARMGSCEDVNYKAHFNTRVEIAELSDKIQSTSKKENFDNELNKTLVSCEEASKSLNLMMEKLKIQIMDNK